MVDLYSHRTPSWFATCVSQQSLSEVEAWLGEMNFRCYHMRSTSIADETSLFDAVLRAVGTTPSGSGLTDEVRSRPILSWDGTADFLYQELVDRPDKRVAILWSEADQMLGDRLQLFLNALEWLHSFAEAFARTDENENWSITLKLILLGNGPAFTPAVHAVYVPPGQKKETGDQKRVPPSSQPRAGESVFVSITRLRVRRWWLVPAFAVQTWRSRQQARSSTGFLAGALAGELWLVFWTFTVWVDEKSMRSFRNSAAHLNAMPRLLRWCDEASFVHWEQENASLPSPETAFQRLRDSGELSKVLYPSPRHAAGDTTRQTVPKLAGEFGPHRIAASS